MLTTGYIVTVLDGKGASTLELDTYAETPEMAVWWLDLLDCPDFEDLLNDAWDAPYRSHQVEDRSAVFEVTRVKLLHLV